MTRRFSRAFTVGSRVAAVFAVALLTTFPRIAEASEPTADAVERARTFFNAGAQAYSAGRFGDAVRAFDHAYELAPRSPLLFSMAQAERKEFLVSADASYLRRAVNHYKSYLEQVPSGGRRAEATEAKAELEAKLARLDPQQLAVAAGVTPEVDKRRARITVYSATLGAQGSVDNGPPQELPYFGDLGPGKHRVRVFAEGYFDAEREVSGDKPVDQPVDLPLKERPAMVTIVLETSAEIFVDGRVVATAPISRPIEVTSGAHVLSVVANGKDAVSQDVRLIRGKPFRFAPKLVTSSQRWGAITMLGAGAVGVVSGVVFGAFAIGRESRATAIEDARGLGNIDASELASHNRAIDQRDAFRTFATVGLSAGAVLAVGGALLFALDKPTINVVPPRGVEPSVNPTPNPTIDLTASPLVGPSLWGASMSAVF